jgi:predicted nucleic acid-binding protein
MTSPIFLDVNVPIYAAGQPHPLKDPCAQVLTLAAQHPGSFITDAEVLQELLHRYLGKGIWLRGRPVVENFAVLMHGRVEPVTADDVRQAVVQVDQYVGLSARDLLHVAIMKRLAILHIVTADRDFDRVLDITRLDPADLATWQHLVQVSGAP